MKAFVSQGEVLDRKYLLIMNPQVGFLILADGLQTLMGVAIIWDILIMNLGRPYRIHSASTNPRQGLHSTGDTSAAKIPTQGKSRIRWAS